MGTWFLISLLWHRINSMISHAFCSFCFSGIRCSHGVHTRSHGVHTRSHGVHTRSAFTRRSHAFTRRSHAFPRRKILTSCGSFFVSLKFLEGLGPAHFYVATPFSYGLYHPF